MTRPLFAELAEELDLRFELFRIPAPAAIAEAYYQLHTQPRSAWTQELDLRPCLETF